MSEKEVSSAFDGEWRRQVFEDGDVHLDYEALGISFSFGADEDGLLSWIEVDNHCPCTVWGKRPWSLSRPELLRFLAEIEKTTATKLGPVTRIGFDGERSVVVDSLFLEFYFDNSDLISSISWGVMVNEADEIAWPEADRPEVGSE